MNVKKEGIILDITTIETIPSEVRPGDDFVKIVGFIEREETGLIHMLLRTAGLWKEPVPRAPPPEPDATPLVAEITVDHDFFVLNCI